MTNSIRLPRNLPEGASGGIALGAIASSTVRHGLDYWQKLRGVRRYPARVDMMPRELAPLLRNVALLRVINGGADYEFRIVGDAHVIAHGFSMQGQHVSEIDKYSPGYGAVLKALYDHAVMTREPFAFRGWMERGENVTQYIYSESVFMPMGPNDTTVDHVLNFSVYTPHDKFEG